MLELISKVTSLGGFLKGSKTVIGLISSLYVLVSHLYPEYAPIVGEAIALTGVSLLPLGATDRVVDKIKKKK